LGWGIRAKMRRRGSSRVVRTTRLEVRTFKVEKAPQWVKHQLVSQLMMFRAAGQPLSSLDEEALVLLGEDAFEYGKGPLPRPSVRSRGQRR
jgi:hypothetical protein